MPHEIVRALVVTDQERYAEYRRRIQPLLDDNGGVFRFDFGVARLVHNESGAELNRVFVLSFPDRVRKERFFGDPRYLAILRELFEPAVETMVAIAEYDR